MRKKRSQYKVCGRLRYNARMRLWTGKKKKWEKRGRFYEDRDGGDVESRQVKVVNPGVRLTNEKRRGERNRKIQKPSKRSSRIRKRKKRNSRIRRKNLHGIVQNQKTGRKRRYGGVKRQTIRKNIYEQRKSYKEYKTMYERRYRKGRRGREESENLIRKRSHRMGRTEIRVDVRRWRSGRVPTLQMGRDLVEHGYVNHVNRDGSVGETAKWQGAKVKEGHGRKLNEAIWKKVKGRASERLEEDAYTKAACGYMEVDYVTGRRVLFRKPKSTEVVIPKGMDFSGWTSL